MHVEKKKVLAILKNGGREVKLTIIIRIGYYIGFSIFVDGFGTRYVNPPIFTKEHRSFESKEELEDKKEFYLDLINKQIDIVLYDKCDSFNYI